VGCAAKAFAPPACRIRRAISAEYFLGTYYPVIGGAGFCIMRALHTRATGLGPGVWGNGLLRTQAPGPKPLALIFGSVAQSVEHWTFNPLVVGSIPTRPTIQKPRNQALVTARRL